MMEPSEKEMMREPGFGWRVPLSILVGVGWLIFLVLWLFFYVEHFPWERNVAIFLLSILLVGSLLGIPWTIWGVRFRTQQETEMWHTKGFKTRVYASVVGALVLFIFLICWFWFFAEPFSIFQNLAIFIASILATGGILGASWAPWGMKHSREFDHHPKGNASYYHKELDDEENKKDTTSNE